MHSAALRNDVEPHHHVSYALSIPARVTALFAVGHLHVGGLNISLSVNGERVCTSHPTYGTEEGVAGNEKVLARPPHAPSRPPPPTPGSHAA